MSLSPTTFRYPFALSGQPEEVKQAHIFAFNGILDLQNAVAALNNKIGPTSNSTTVVNETVSGGIPSPPPAIPGLGGVNDQTGATSYTTASTDNGILLILNNSSAVAVTLNSAMTTPFFFFATNFGTGAVTFTPTTGLVNGTASFLLPEGGLFWIGFDGTNWKTSDVLVLAQTFTAVAHEWINSYNAATGVFTATQPTVSDVTGAAPTASPTFTGTVTQPDATVLTAATVAATATAGAGALPAAPQQFLTISVNGSSFKIPLYLP
jgi:hypothetical protein